MPGTTSRGLPYPTIDDPVRNGAAAIESLAKAIDAGGFVQRSATAVQSLVTATMTPIQLPIGTVQGATYDATAHAVNLTVPGLWLVTAGLGFATNPTGRRLVLIDHYASGMGGAATEVARVETAAGASIHTLSCTAVIRVVGTDDHVQLVGYQTSGGALNTSVSGAQVRLHAARIAP